MQCDSTLSDTWSHQICINHWLDCYLSGIMYYVWFSEESIYVTKWVMSLFCTNPPGMSHVSVQAKIIFGVALGG